MNLTRPREHIRYLLLPLVSNFFASDRAHVEVSPGIRQLLIGYQCDARISITNDITQMLMHRLTGRYHAVRSEYLLLPPRFITYTLGLFGN